MHAARIINIVCNKQGLNDCAKWYCEPWGVSFPNFPTVIHTPKILHPLVLRGENPSWWCWWRFACHWYIEEPMPLKISKAAKYKSLISFVLLEIHNPKHWLRNFITVVGVDSARAQKMSCDPLKGTISLSQFHCSPHYCVFCVLLLPPWIVAHWRHSHRDLYSLLYSSHVCGYLHTQVVVK